MTAIIYETVSEKITLTIEMDEYLLQLVVTRNGEIIAKFDACLVFDFLIESFKDAKPTEVLTNIGIERRKYAAQNIFRLYGEFIKETEEW